MEKFWQIVNHKDAVQIKIEVSKSLVKFTQDNIRAIIDQKQNFINNRQQASKVNKDGGSLTNEQI